jgi:hypothetical protein
MAVGKEVFDTCVWVGRFLEHWRVTKPSPIEANVELIYRREVKLHICGNPRAKDANIRQALIDKFGVVGSKNNQGPLYGVKSHAWAALGVAVTALHL